MNSTAIIIFGLIIFILLAYLGIVGTNEAINFQNKKRKHSK
tara:strand:+ start:680 stop:802 length:123 start_codon:yes stop_codon:yes gene_type:complete